MNRNLVQLSSAARWLLLSTAFFCTFLPLHESFSIHGEWYTLGWPFPALALKIGYMSPESPRGLHLQFHPFLLLNAVVWLGVFLVFQRAVRASFLSHRSALIAAFFALIVSGLWFAFGAINLITVWGHS